MALSLLPFVLQNLNTLIQSKVGLICGVDKEMKKLSSILSTIQAVLQDAEQKQFKDKAIQDWLRKVQDATYEVDDILDECSTEVLQWESKVPSSGGSLKKVSTSLLTCYPVKNTLFRHKIGNRIKEIIKYLDDIADERNKFHLHEGAVEKRDVLVESRETSSLLTQPEMYGRDGDKEKIVNVLVQDVCDCQQISVYPIIGMGGLGKTSLAQMAFNDERVQNSFEPRVWVYVSQNFDVKRVIKTIIETISGKTCETSDLDSLQKRLQELLNGRRYLLVLDDVWDEDQEKWDTLKCLLACGSKGSSTIVTTRIEKVASVMGTLSPHRLSFLSEDDCWLLFSQRAFGQGNEEHPNLVAIGKEIVKKCGGVPLAAKALGGLMRFKTEEEEEWLNVKESEIWNLHRDENSILPALRLSYCNLPLELRRCFSYCAIFPKGYQIEKGKLISLWMANGYVSSEGKLEMEYIGDQIWKELCLRSFFQEVKVKYNENGSWQSEIGCTMHDLLHDLAQSVMENESQMIDFQSSSCTFSKKVRHFAFDDMPTDDFYNMFGKLVSVRTFLQSLGNGFSYKLLCDVKKLRSLRVLDARYRYMTKLPSSIGKLRLLRYLDLSGNELIKQLPDSICSLLNLQTLNLNGCCYLKRLPENMKYLRNLRHLYLERCPLIDTPPEIGQLTCLKTLSKFVVGERRGCHLAELSRLNLGGKLCIEHLERVRNAMDAKIANLVGKKNLRRLELRWEANAECEESQGNVEQLLEDLQPPPNINALIIENYKGTHFPLWMTDSSINLGSVVELKLFNCKNLVRLPSFGQIPLLRSLGITEIDNIEYIDDDDDFFLGGGPVRRFQSLKELDIIELPNLKGLSKDEAGELFPRLRKLKIEGCPKLSLPCQRTKVESCTNVEGRRRRASISKVSSLASLDVVGNKEASCFPEELLSDLTLLQSLRIGRFTNLEVLPKDLPNLLALKSLEIWHCADLESLPELRGLESLQRLTVCYCNKLSSLSEGLRHLTALNILWIENCPELVALPEEGLRGLESLQSLYVRDCKKLSSLSEGLRHLTALKILRITNCPELVALPEEGLRGLESLQRLCVYNCKKLSSLSEGLRHLTALEELWIYNCPELVALPEGIKYLNSLRNMEIKDQKKMVALPEALQHAPTLKSLDIGHCPNLTSLPDWLGNLTSLEKLAIHGCPKIASLPASIQSLSKLKRLNIRYCDPKLRRRYKKGKGKDWSKIQHVPMVLNF